MFFNYIPSTFTWKNALVAFYTLIDQEFQFEYNAIVSDDIHKCNYDNLPTIIKVTEMAEVSKYFRFAQAFENFKCAQLAFSCLLILVFLTHMPFQSNLLPLTST